MHDFDVILPDGRCVALEVTSAIDGVVVALSDAAFGREGRQQRWPAPDLANDWIVTIPQRPVRVAEMMSAMLPILEIFEEHEHADVDPHINYAYVSPRSEMPTAVVEAARRMVELGGDSGAGARAAGRGRRGDVRHDQWRFRGRPRRR